MARAPGGAADGPGRLELRPIVAEARATDPRRLFANVRCTASPPLPAPDKQAVLCVRPDGADDAATADSKLLLGPAVASNAEIGAAHPSGRSGSMGADWQVVVDLTLPGEQALQRLTATAACQPADSVRRQVAVVLDGSVIINAPVDTGVPCRHGISGGSIAITRLTEQQARTLSALLGSRPLPVRLKR